MTLFRITVALLMLTVPLQAEETLYSQSGTAYPFLRSTA